MLTVAWTMHLSDVAGNMLALLLTIAAASITYFLLEKPFLRLKQRFTYVRSRL